MRSSSLLAASALAVLGFASPNPVKVAARSCTIKLPTTYQLISEVYSKSAYPQGRYFDVSQLAAPGSNVDTLVHFTDIPVGSYGCQLAVEFTYGYSIPSTGNTQLNVYALSTDITEDSTYEKYFPSGTRGTPMGAFLFGTTTLNGGPAIINSATCAQNMSFLFEIASETDAGSVQFQDAGDNLTGIGGFYMTYDC